MRSPLLGTKKKDHKYILRVENGGKGNYRYFYTKEEVDAYKKAQKEQKPKATTQTKDDKLGFFIPVPSSWLPEHPWWERFITPSTVTPNPTIKPANPSNPSNPLIPSNPVDTTPKRKIRPIDESSPYPPSPKYPLPAEVSPGIYPKTSNFVGFASIKLLKEKEKESNWFSNFFNNTGSTSDFIDTQFPFSYADSVEAPKRNIPPLVDELVEQSLPKISGIHSIEDDQLATNPNYTERWATEKQYFINCQNCTYAWVMRRRGYDVEAKPNYGEGDDEYSGNTMEDGNIFVNPSGAMLKNCSDKRQAALNFIKEVLGYGEGAYGSLGVHWELGGGHSLVWSVENGNVIIRDAQVGDVYNSTDAIIALFNDVVTTKDFSDRKTGSDGYNRVLVAANPVIWRLDDCDVTDEILKHVKPSSVSHSEDVDYLANCIFTGMEWALQHGL